MKTFASFIKEHTGALIGAVAGLIIGVLILTIGFFPVLFLCLLAGFGALIGGVPGVRQLLNKWLGGLFGGLLNK